MGFIDRLRFHDRKWLNFKRPLTTIKEQMLMGWSDSSTRMLTNFFLFGGFVFFFAENKCPVLFGFDLAIEALRLL